MNTADALPIGAFILVVALLVKPVGVYLKCVFERQPTALDPVLLPAERVLHWFIGVDPRRSDARQVAILIGHTSGLTHEIDRLAVPVVNDQVRSHPRQLALPGICVAVCEAQDR